jgi:hypothetical protein
MVGAEEALVQAEAREDLQELAGDPRFFGRQAVESRFHGHVIRMARFEGKQGIAEGHDTLPAPAAHWQYGRIEFAG